MSLNSWMALSSVPKIRGFVLCVATSREAGCDTGIVMSTRLVPDPGARCAHDSRVTEPPPLVSYLKKVLKLPPSPIGEEAGLGSGDTCHAITRHRYEI